MESKTIPFKGLGEYYFRNMTEKFIKTQKALSLTRIDLADFVINPYRGCRFGCLYCYSRSNKNISVINKPWGSYVYIKQDFPEVLRKELSRIKKGRVLLGSTVEPFQPFEKKYRITEKVLEILKDHHVPVTILTRSVSIIDYLPLLEYSDENMIYFTYNSQSVSERFEKLIFPRKKRLEAIWAIHKSRIKLVVYISPVFPLLTDIEEIFRELKGKATDIYLEAYNAKMGNWNDIKLKMTEDMIREYERIYSSQEHYDQYWSEFKKKTDKMNREARYQIKYFIYPYNSYYNE